MCPLWVSYHLNVAQDFACVSKVIVVYTPLLLEITALVDIEIKF